MNPGSPFGPNGGDGNGMFPGAPGGPVGPPSSDAMFENFLGDEDDLIPDAPEAVTRENEILTAGLKFFEKIKKMK